LKNVNSDIQASNRIISIINNSKEQYEKILNELENAYVVINDKYQILDANKKFAEISQDFFLRRDLFAYVYPGSVNILKQEIDTVLNSGKPTSVELKLYNGRSFLFTVSPLEVSRGEEGKVLKLLGTDITELREREGLIMDVFRTVSVGLLIVGSDNKILPGYSNFTKIILENSQLTGESVFELFFDKSVKKFTPDELEAIEGLKSFGGKMSKEEFSVCILNAPKMIEIPSNLRVNGKRIVQVTYEAIVEDNAVVRFLVILQDMSDYIDLNPPTFHDDVAKMVKLFDTDVESLMAIMEDVDSMVSRIKLPMTEINDEHKGIFHSVKGMLRMIGLNYMGGTIHHLEDEIKRAGGGLPPTFESVWSPFVVKWTKLLQIYHATEVKKDDSSKADVGVDEHATDYAVAQRLLEQSPSVSTHPVFSSVLTSHYSELQSGKELLNFCLKLMEKNSIDFGFAVVPNMTSDPVFFSGPVFTALKSSLIHFINNSFAHGFSDPNKINYHISLKIKRSADGVTLDYTDNGSGVNVAKVREKLKASGEKDVDKLTDDQVATKIFLSGISTKDEVNEIAGRGVGLSGALLEIERSRGSIKLENFTGGVHFNISVPMLDSQYQCPLIVTAPVIEQLFKVHFADHFDVTEGFSGIYQLKYPKALHQALQAFKAVEGLKIKLNSKASGKESNAFPGQESSQILLQLNQIHSHYDSSATTLHLWMDGDLSAALKVHLSVTPVSSEKELSAQISTLAKKMGVEVKIDQSTESLSVSSENVHFIMNKAIESKAFLQLSGATK
jgi:hypothetical protein